MVTQEVQLAVLGAAGALLAGLARAAAPSGGSEVQASEADLEVFTGHLQWVTGYVHTRGELAGSGGQQERVLLCAGYQTVTFCDVMYVRRLGQRLLQQSHSDVVTRTARELLHRIGAAP